MRLSPGQGLSRVGKYGKLMTVWQPFHKLFNKRSSCAIIFC